MKSEILRFVKAKTLIEKGEKAFVYDNETKKEIISFFKNSGIKLNEEELVQNGISGFCLQKNK